jgi:uncharacterized iron-regulated membrane protein
MRGGGRGGDVKFGVSLDTLFAHAAGSGQSWATMQMRMPRSSSAPLVVTVASTTWLRPDRRTSVTLDPASGAVVKREGFEAVAPLRRVLSWNRVLHTGEAFGIMGQTVAGLVSLAGVFLVYTGFALTWRRARAALQRRAKARSGLPMSGMPEPALANVGQPMLDGVANQASH